MSHFTHIKTRFKNLSYLEKALNQLDISYQEQENLENHLEPKTRNLVIPQSNGYDLEFIWNKNEYELIVDLSFWEQSYPIENFIDKVTQQYAGEVLIGESKKNGFHPITYKQNLDKSTTVVLERWNHKT